MPNDLSDLFDGPLDQPAQGADNSRASIPEPAQPSAYAPSMDGLVQEVGQLKQMMQALFLRNQAAPVASPQPAPPSPSLDLAYQDHEFLDESAAQALLSSPNVRGELNSMLNKTARQVHTALASEIVRNRTDVDSLRQSSEQAWQRMETGRQMQADFSAFYGEYPDLEPHADLVQLEAQRMANEYNQNPYAFTGLTRESVIKGLAERTQRRVAAIVAAASGQPESPPSRLPARRTQVERGSGTRVGAAPVPKDANARELQEMDRFIRG